MTVALLLGTGCATPGGDRDVADDGAVQRLDTAGPLREVLLVSDSEASRVTLHLAIGAGEAAARGPEGIAHYVEHLAWLNAHRDDATVRSNERDSNATTGAWTTAYFETVAEADMETGLARLVRVFEPFALDDRFMREERDILRREHDFRVGSEQEEALRRDIAARLFGGSGFARSPLGTVESLGALTLADARALHARTHRPGNTTLLVSGDIDAGRVAEALATLPPSIAGEASGTPVPAPMPDPPAPLRDERDVAGDADVSPSLQVFRLFVEPSVRPAADTEARRDARHVLLFRALDSTRPGGLAGPLRFDAFVAERHELSLTAHGPEQALLGFVATPDRGVTLDTLQRAFETALAASATAGVPEATLEAVRTNLLADIDRVDERGADTRDDAIALLDEGRVPYGFAEWRRAVVETSTEEIHALLAAAATGGRTVIRRVASAADENT